MPDNEPHPLSIKEREDIVRRIEATDDEDEKNRLRSFLVRETDNGPEEGDDVHQTPEPDFGDDA